MPLQDSKTYWGEKAQLLVADLLMAEGKLFVYRDLEKILEGAKVIDPATLANRLNFRNFVSAPVLAYLHDPETESDRVIPVFPGACSNQQVKCRFAEEIVNGEGLAGYRLTYLIIDDGRSMILAPATVQGKLQSEFTVRLPGNAYVVGKRKVRRFTCRDIMVQLAQSGFMAQGRLLDFSAEGFRISFRPDRFSAQTWFNPEQPVMTFLRRNEQVLFAEPCRCIRQTDDRDGRQVVLSPVQNEIHRFKKSVFRNPRQHLSPTPVAVFDHPFIMKKVNLPISDVSTSGFSVLEKTEEALLIPAMVIPELTIHFAGGLRINCVAQVVYRLEQDEKRSRYGFSVLDMDGKSYRVLMDILNSALDPQTGSSNISDMEELWEFFFDTGFLYSKKHELIREYPLEFREVYKRFYQDNPEIGRHFVYQRNGRIYAHISMVKAYNRSWMIHHHAARPGESRRSGFIVLKQIMHYLNDLHRFPSSDIDYVFCYFRPENKFPDRVFGDFFRSSLNSGFCSMELFGYLSFHQFSIKGSLPDNWTLDISTKSDIEKAYKLYNRYSEGFLLDVFGLASYRSGNDPNPLETAYQKCGFFRRFQLYSLKEDKDVKAIMIADQSDVGLNLAELLNSIKILVLDPDLEKDMLLLAFTKILGQYRTGIRVPMLIYPFEYMCKNSIPHEKKYNLWAYDTRFVGIFIDYLQKRFKMSYWVDPASNLGVIK